MIRGPEGEVFDNPPGCFLKVMPQEQLVWTSGLGPGLRPLRTPAEGFAMNAVQRFADAPGGGTFYHARVLHAHAAGKAAHEATGLHDGWGAVTAQLDMVAGAL